MASLAMASGAQAEALVAKLLCRHHWRLVDCNWRCRWGELDLLLAKPGRLLLVEVKSRQRWGLDQGGLLACGPRKRRRLARALRCWLAEHRSYANHSIEVHLALVNAQAQVRWWPLAHLG
tara:strand:+ start:56 stop:415 length:360 start_codon:yes stop_codon:yes gene_type:complete